MHIDQSQMNPEKNNSSNNQHRKQKRTLKKSKQSAQVTKKQRLSINMAEQSTSESNKRSLAHGTQAHNSCESVENLLLEIKDLSSRPSRLLKIRQDTSDPFFKVFSQEFPLTRTLSKGNMASRILTVTWDSILSSPEIDLNMRSGIEAYNLLQQWLQKLRDHKQWNVPKDEETLISRLKNVKACLELHLDPSATNSLIEPDSEFARVQGGLQSTYKEKHLPPRLEALISEIERLAGEDSTIPLGTQDETFFQGLAKSLLSQSRQNWRRDFDQ